MAEKFQLSEEEQRELLPSGKQSLLANRVGWASTYLKKAGLLKAPRKGRVYITDRGKAVLAEHNGVIDRHFLERFEEFREFKNFRRNSKPGSVEPTTDDDSETPEEALETAYKRLTNTLASDLLERIVEQPPDFFEKLVVELLVAMGYGGSLKDAGQKVGRTGDGGIDGIIKEDRLGLDFVYIQAKRWNGSVGRPEIQKFVGALQGKNSHKGVFITTGTYSREAREFAESVSTNVVLIDGDELAALMIDYDIGVTSEATYKLKRVDNDFFGD
jgi:restriction system protein